MITPPTCRCTFPCRALFLSQGHFSSNDYAACVQPIVRLLDYTPWTTAGDRLPFSLGLRYATMTIRTADSTSDFCWCA